MDDVAAASCIVHRPARVVQLFEPGELIGFDGPLRSLIPPPSLCVYRGVSTGINDYFCSGSLQAFCQLSDKKLSASVVFGRNCDERRRYESNLHEAPISKPFPPKTNRLRPRCPNGLAV